MLIRIYCKPSLSQRISRLSVTYLDHAAMLTVPGYMSTFPVLPGSQRTSRITGDSFGRCHRIMGVQADLISFLIYCFAFLFSTRAKLKNCLLVEAQHLSLLSMTEYAWFTYECFFRQSVSYPI